MSSPTQTDGAVWESHAAELLEHHGLTVLARGYRCRGGELDLICHDDDTLVVVEVRARRQRTHGDAAASVDAAKIRRIVFATRHFLMSHPELGSAPLRFDVIAIDEKDSPRPKVRWIRNAFDGT